MSQITPLTTLPQWESLWKQLAEPNAEPVLLFKRSPICPTSLFAEASFTRFVESLSAEKSPAVYSIDVIAARPISQRIAADTGVRHESPQALLLAGAHQVKWQASHGDINEDSLEQQVPAH